MSSYEADQNPMELDDMDIEVLEAAGSDASNYSESSDSDQISLTIPSTTPEWHDSEPLLQHFTLEDLNARGYINLETICTDASFGYATRRALPAARWREQRGLIATGTGEATKIIDKKAASAGKSKQQRLGKYYRIHPLLHPDMWDFAEMEEKSTGFWEALRPVFQLATLLLEHDDMIGYIIGLLDITKHKRIDHPEAEKRRGEKLFWFEKRENPSNEEKLQAWMELHELTKTLWWREFRFVEVPSTHGLTNSRNGSELIFINAKYFDILCRGELATAGARSWFPGSDEDSARLRVQFVLAVTMVHEIIHALWWKKFPDLKEPFYRDTRASETGWQWEMLLFTGLIDGLGKEYGFPYGCSMHTWPASDDSRHDDKKTILMSQKKWGGRDHFYEFMVEMSFLQNFFTHDFWEEADRYGSSIFSPARKLGIRTVNRLRFLDDEQPVVLGPHVDEPPSPNDHDAYGIIDRK